MYINTFRLHIQPNKCINIEKFPIIFILYREPLHILYAAAPDWFSYYFRIIR